MAESWDDLIAGLKQGSVRSLARMITAVENRASGWMEAMKRVHSDGRKAGVIGVTGPPGSGKSSLTDKITWELVQAGRSVGIIAVDPSSPYSGGALLGDRVRMRDVSILPGVFVRSMATRGALGGLTWAAHDVVKIMAAFGKDVILIETVGVGQDEIEVVKTADLVMLVCVPGQGDAIQAIKAGVMEIADLFVVNKADLDGADRVVADVEAMLDLCSNSVRARPPVLKTAACTGGGVPELVAAVQSMLELRSEDRSRRKVRAKEELVRLLSTEIARLVHEKWNQDGSMASAVEDILSSRKDPYSITQEMLAPVAAYLK
ncbi:MAG: methylmalonyl Co-A mutase-associated GTPase MeaB [Desulfomonilaceae bacterium]|nr:methylmalonyl Co-A mutase-associated GTPase MeaB [Desulfomonilaceae bacterium]